MTAEDCARCGHTRMEHSDFWPGGRWPGNPMCLPHAGGRCKCAGWTLERLPAPGERLEFGKHRMNSPEAETAEAWPPLRERR